MQDRDFKDLYQVVMHEYIHHLVTELIGCDTLNEHG